MREITPVRPMSLSMLKNNSKVVLQAEPREGTKLRELYDLFVNNPGKPLPLYWGYLKGGEIVQLKDYYGLDIRIIKKGSKLRGASMYVLASYWNGKEYVDVMSE